MRIVALIGLGLATLGGAIAGNIVPINLTAQPVGVATCATVACGPVVSSTTTGTFENQLFTTIYASSPPPTPSNTAQTPIDSPAPFLLTAQSGGANDDAYLSTNTTNLETSILVDLGTCTGTAPSSACGLQNVDDLYTMIQATGAFNLQGITITLNGVAANGITPISGTIDLTSGVDYRSTSNANAANITCTDVNYVGGGSCATATSDTAAGSHTDTTPGGTLAGAEVATYNNVFGPQTASGKDYYLDVQELELGNNFLNGAYLDSITITNVPATGGKSQMVFSGLSADQVTSTPEPGTVAFLGIGLGLIALRKIRGRRADRSAALD